MIRWMGIQAEIDPRPGGVYRLDPTEEMSFVASTSK